MKHLLHLLAGLILCTNLAAQEISPAGNPQAIIRTNMGDITLELFADKAPITVENFIRYANSGFYAGTIFHRVISHFMIQGGGFTTEMQQKPTGEAITNEASNGLSNVRGTIAMARSGHPHSATTQFFINVQDNPGLDYTGENSSRAWGYAVFGRVTAGMEVVDAIRSVETTAVPPHADVPKSPVTIDQVEIVMPGGE